MNLTRAAAVVALIASACTTTTGTTPTPTPTATVDGPRITAGSSDFVCWTGEGQTNSGNLKLSDVTAEMGMVDPLTGMHGHTAIWTDSNADNIPDLFVGTFADREDEVYALRGASGPSPDRLLLGGDTFEIDESFPGALSRSSGGISADLDNDGDLDLVVSRNIKDPGLEQTPTRVYENDGETLKLVDEHDFDDLGGRSIAVLDYDADGLLDLFIVVDQYANGTSRLMRNEGDLRFSDETESAGLPDDILGLGVVAADFNSDRMTDLFVSGSNRLFIADGSSFEEADNSVFEWETFGNEDDVAGASAADVNRDGHLDLVVGQHFNSTIDFDALVPVRLYLNDGEGKFTDVTDETTLSPLQTKAPHVEFVDLNNDGWLDILTSASADGGPAVFINLGLSDDIPTFDTPSGLGAAQYWVAAPTTDYDLDGRMDVFLLEWEPALPSLLLRNETDGGNWLQIGVHGQELNDGIGWRIEVFASDHSLVGAQEITVTQGYSAGVLPIAHFGLGDLDSVDIRMTPPNGGDIIELGGVAANQRIRWPNGC